LSGAFADAGNQAYTGPRQELEVFVSALLKQNEDQIRAHAAEDVFADARRMSR